MESREGDNKAPKTATSQPGSKGGEGKMTLAEQLAARAQIKQKQRQQKPMPKPPARRPMTAKPIPAATPVAGAAAGAAAAKKPGEAPDLTERVRQLQTQFNDLEAKAQLGGLYEAIGSIDQRLLDFPITLDSLRQRGYVHSGYLESKLEALDNQWDQVRPQVEALLQDHVQRIDREMGQVQPHMNNMQPTDSSIRLGETLLNGLSRRIEGATSAITGLYDGIYKELDKLGWEFRKLTRMMDLITKSPHIRLLKAEGPLAAVEAVWHRDGDKGPKGVLIFTDQRLLFEERDEVVTKRRLGIFKAESQMVQELHIEAQASDIHMMEAKKEGGFLGMGKDDILELTFAATAPISRARFHLQGQKSADWAALIKKVQTGEIDHDRAGLFVEALGALAEAAASFPTSCPNCLAAVEPPARGVTSITCEFCGTIITPAKPVE